MASSSKGSLMKKDPTKEKTPRLVLGIDPGQKGALVWLSENGFTHELMPLDELKWVNFERLLEIFAVNPCDHVYLERAKAYGMNAGGAFSYGVDFGTILCALRIVELPYTLVDPHVWTKDLHADLDKRLKPKEKSLLALDRFFPKLKHNIPKGPRSGKMHEGVVDALLIAYYGLRHSKRDK
jgi:hypothetical protein